MRKIWAAAAAALILLLSATCFAEVKNIAGQCRFWVSKGSKSAITDDAMSTAWKPSGEAEMRVMLPESGAAWMQINWSIAPTSYTLTEYDANQAEISSRTTTEEENFGCISQMIPIGQGTRYISVKFKQEGQGIHRVRVYPEGELPATAVQWEKPLDKCDLMVVSTHQDDEWLWFGAIIPYYDLVKDKDVQVVYMANCGRYRYQEALNSIAVSGVKTYPYFVGLRDRRDDSLEAAVRTWKSKDYILETVVGVIRRFKPEVILTHDWNGEYGHPQHKLTSRCMEYAIEAAADPTQYPESAAQYGAWQVKKLYRHLEKKGRIEFDWHVAYEEFGGRTGLEVAVDSMAQHASQLKYYQVKDHGKYDNALFGLSWSAVGDDLLHQDLFENIPETAAEPASEIGAAADASLGGAAASMGESSDEWAAGAAAGEAPDGAAAANESSNEWAAGADGDATGEFTDGIGDATGEFSSGAAGDAADEFSDGADGAAAGDFTNGADGAAAGDFSDGADGAATGDFSAAADGAAAGDFSADADGDAAGEFSDGIAGAGDGFDGDAEFAAGISSDVAPGVTIPPVVEAGEKRGGSAAPIVIGIGVAAAACGGAGYALYLRQQKLRRRRRKRKVAPTGSARKPTSSHPTHRAAPNSHPTQARHQRANSPAIPERKPRASSK